MQSSVYELGKQRGEQAGKLEGKLEERREMLVRLYARRLQRPVTGAERDAIERRMGLLGVDRLLDAQETMSADALAAWLADPSAT